MMSRTKSTGLIKRAVRGTSDAGRAGWRPRVDMAESARINGLRPAAVAVEAPPIEQAPLCECDPSLPARDRCNKTWIRCNAGIRARRHLEPAAGQSSPIDPGGPRETAALVRTLEDFGAAAEAPTEPEAPKRRMVQAGLFDGLGVKI